MLYESDSSPAHGIQHSFSVMTSEATVSFMDTNMSAKFFF